MTKLKNELNAFIAKRDKLELLVDDFRNNVKFFLSMELTAELNEQSILEFAKISNFLL